MPLKRSPSDNAAMTAAGCPPSEGANMFCTVTSGYPFTLIRPFHAVGGVFTVLVHPV